MTFDLTGAQIVGAVVSLLIASLAYFVKMWINRLESELVATNKKHAELEEKFNNYRIQSVIDFARKSDITNGREEMMKAIHKIESKVDRIFEKLDTKADK